MFLQRYLIIFLWGQIFLATYAAAQESDQILVDGIEPVQNELSESSQSILQYQEQIKDQETLHGVFDAQLGEQLLGLGLLYKNQGEYSKAGEVLERSLHIKKINEGIQSMSQVPILNALIEVNSAARKWDELNRNYHLLLWINQRNLGSGNPAILPVIEAVGQWKFIAYNNGLLSEKPSTTLTDLTNMYRTTINIMEDLYGENDPRLIVPLRGLSLARYQLVQQIMNTSVDEFEGTGRRTTTERVCQPVMNPDGTIRMACYFMEVPDPQYYVRKQQTKDRIVLSHMGSVRNTLNRIVEINASNPSLSHQQHALALVNLGDWYFIKRRKQTAIDKYKNAYQILVENNSEQKIIDDLFNKPVPIPPMSITSLSTEENDNKQKMLKPYIKLAFEVTVDGKARKIKVVEESDPNNYLVRKNAKDLIKSSLFRPRLEDGIPVATQQMELLFSGIFLKKRMKRNISTYDGPSGTNFTRSRVRR